MDNLHRHRRRHRDPRRFIAQERRQVRSKWLFYIFATTTLMLTLPFAFTLTLAIHFNSSIFIVDCFYTAFFTFVSCSAVMLFAKYSQIDLTLYAPRRLTTTLTVLSLSTTYYALVGFFCLRMRHDTQHTQIHKSAFSVFFTILIMVPFIMGTSSLPILCLLVVIFYPFNVKLTVCVIL